MRTFVTVAVAAIAAMLGLSCTDAATLSAGSPSIEGVDTDQPTDPGPDEPSDEPSDSAYQPPRSWNGLDVAVELQAAVHLATRTDDDGHTFYEFFDPDRDGAPTVTLDDRVCGWANQVADEAAPDDPMMRLRAVQRSVNELAVYGGDALVGLVARQCAEGYDAAPWAGWR